MKRATVSLLATLLACSGGEEPCDELNAHLEQCFGSAGSQCDAERAEKMLEMSCEERADCESKQDGVHCDSRGRFCDKEPIFV